MAGAFELELGRLALALPAGDGRGAVRRSAVISSRVIWPRWLYGKPTIIIPKCIRLAMIEKSVVSLPPCCVALEVKDVREHQAFS